MPHAFPLYLGFTIMSVASLVLYAHGRKHGPYSHHTFIHSAVVFIAATAYLAMATGIGVFAMGDTPLYAARYADWSLTTPLLLTGLVLTGLHEHEHNAGYLVAVIVLDVLMVVAGLLSAAASDAGTVWAFFWWSSAAFAGVLFLLWKPVMTISKRYGGEMNRIYKKNLLIVTVLWVLYPVVFAFGPEGLGLYGVGLSVWAILVLDVCAKAIYGFVAASAFKGLAADTREDRIRQEAAIG